MEATHAPWTQWHTDAARFLTVTVLLRAALGAAIAAVGDRHSGATA